MDQWRSASDEELLLSARRDGESFGEFYRRYEEPMLRFFVRRVRDPELAADLAAETFAAALLAARRFRPGPPPADAWLFGIARNVLSASARRKRVAAKARRRLALPPLVITDDILERIAALADPVVARVDELPEEQRDALQARIVEERDYAEIAQDLHCSEALVRQRVSRALGTLRDQGDEATK